MASHIEVNIKKNLTTFPPEMFCSTQKESGMTMIMLIISIVVLSIVGVSIFSLYWSSALIQIKAQLANKAYYLAESGVRIIAGEYSQAGVGAKDTRLATLDGRTFTFPDNSGQFIVNTYPSWLYAINGYSSGATSITIYLPGERPLLDIDGTTSAALPSRGLLKVIGKTTSALFTAAPGAGTRTANGTPVTFAISTSFEATASAGFPYAITAGDEFLIGFVESTAGGSIFKYTNLYFNAGDSIYLVNYNSQAEIFPPSNGIFSLVLPDGVYSYKYDNRIIWTHWDNTVELTNIQSAPGTTAKFPFQLIYNGTGANLYDRTKTTQIFIGKAIGIKSKSTYGN